MHLVIYIFDMHVANLRYRALQYHPTFIEYKWERASQSHSSGIQNCMSAAAKLHDDNFIQSNQQNLSYQGFPCLSSVTGMFIVKCHYRKLPEIDS